MKADEKRGLAKIVAAFESARDELDQLISELQERYDDLSEKAQEGEKGEELSGEINTLQAAYDEIDSAVSDLNGALESE